MAPKRLCCKTLSCMKSPCMLVRHCLQAAAELGGAVDSEGRLLELNANAPWRQALLKKLGLSNDKKSNLQVCCWG